VYTTTNSGAGRLGETATVAEDRCVGGCFPATTLPQESGTANSRDVTLPDDAPVPKATSRRGAAGTWVLSGLPPATIAELHAHRDALMADSAASGSP